MTYELVGCVHDEHAHSLIGSLTVFTGKIIRYGK